MTQLTVISNSFDVSKSAPIISFDRQQAMCMMQSQERELSVCVQLYCMAFELLDQEWLSMRASYMDFPSVIARVRKQCESALASLPASLPDLRQLLVP